MWRILFLLIVLGGQAMAGAWPREKGELFLSFSSTINAGGSSAADYTSIYAEYGLTGKITAGLDLGTDGIRSSKTLGFVNFPLGRAEGDWKFALELGGGQIDNRNVLRPGFSLGRPLQLGERGGWLAIDTRWVLFQDSIGGERLESDITFGVSMNARHKVMVQFQAGDPPGGRTYLRVSPSWVFERKPGRHIELGVTAGVIESDDLGLKLGFWRKR